jgi:hypothetical protein
MLAVTAIALWQDFLRIPPEQRAVPEASAELWAAGWKADELSNAADMASCHAAGLK